MKTLLIITAYIAPFVFIPAVFRFAGGVLGNLSGMVNNRAKGLFDRQKKYRGEERGRKGADMKAGNRFRGGTGPTYDALGNRISKGNLRGRLNSRLGYLSKTGAAGFSFDRETRAARMRAAESGHISKDVNELAESDEMKSLAGNEDLLQAGMHVGTDEKQGTDASIREYLMSRGQTGEVLEQNTAAVRAAVRAKSQTAYNAMASVMTAGTGTGYAGGQGEMMAAINQAAGGDRALAGRLLNMARGQAERANRPDLQGSGFGESLDALNQQYNNGDTVAAQNITTNAMDLAVLRSKGINTVVNSRNNQFSRLAPALATAYHDAVGRSAAAREAGDDAAANAAETEATEIAAQLTAVRSSINAGTSAENRQVAARLFSNRADAVRTDAAGRTVSDAGVGLDLSSSQSIDEQLGAQLEATLHPRVITPPTGPTTQTVRDPNDRTGTKFVEVLTDEGRRVQREQREAQAAINARTNEIRARAGLYDQGTRGIMDPSLRGTAAGGELPPPPPPA